MKQASPNDLIILSNQGSEPLARETAELLHCPFTKMHREQFSDGEIYHSFPTDIGGRDIIIIAATPDDKSLLELVDIIDGCHHYMAHSVNVIVPYLGYSTMEQTKPGVFEIPKGITRTRQIFRARPHFTAFIDLHSEAVLNAHCGEVHTLHIQTDELVVAKIQSLGLDDFVLVSPDYGRSKWVARLAGKLDVAHTAADKDRFAMDKTMVGQVASVVFGKTVIICDDMIRTGGSIIQTADRCRDAGATEVIVMATHLVMAGNSSERFKENNIHKIIGANTYPNRQSDSLYDLYSVAPLIERAIHKQLRIQDS
ncbi:MAG: ribose-phosphate diphosphokinase [Desulfobulbaceae bacterium]|jgi:ribose-phosphate pyrophosphokinase|nr:ribose-phosphate diphosphokinase [Desulfobulbaceae bacterium]